MALYFECLINKKRTPSLPFFGDFAHWVPTQVIFNKYKLYSVMQ